MAVDNLSADAAAFLACPAPLPIVVSDVGAKLWFAVLCDLGPFTIDRVERFASSVGIETYTPRQRRLSKVKIRRSGSRGWEHRVVLEPLLGRYLFTSLPAEATPFGCLTTPAARRAGVVAFVGIKGRGPITFRSAIIVDLREREAAGEFDKTVKRARKRLSKLPDWAEPGGAVRVVVGPFEGFDGVIEEHIAEGRVRVGVNIFGRSTSLELDLASIEPTNALRERRQS